MNLVLNLLFLQSLVQIVECKYWILSLDSAKFSALLTAEFVAYMEKKSYLIARREYCIEERQDERLAMYELFDMIAGSETGAIIAATITVPDMDNLDKDGKPKNKYWATRASSFFKQRVDLLYSDSQMSEGLKIFLTLLFLSVVGFLFYKVAEVYFSKDLRNCQICEIKKYIKINKRQAKNKSVDHDEYQKIQQQCLKLLENEQDIKIHSIFQTVNNLKPAGNSNLEILMKQQQLINKLDRQRRKNTGLKWYAMLFGILVMGLLQYYVFIPYFKFKYLNLQSNQVLFDYLDFLPDDIPLEKALSKEILLTSWDFNNRMPYTMTKSNMKNLKMMRGIDSLKKAVFLSACNPSYFIPCQLKDAKNKEDKLKKIGKITDIGSEKVFISGDAMAVSPALLAYLNSIENGIDPAELQVVSVGSISQRADKIHKNIGIIEWASRIGSLQGDSKKHSQDYLLQYMHNENGLELQKFVLKVSREDKIALGQMSDRLPALINLKNDFINDNRKQIEEVLQELVKEKFQSKDQCKN